VFWIAMALPAGAVTTTCPDTSVASVVVTADGLHVIKPGTEEIQADDVLVQLNSHVLRTCADLARAMKEARERRLAPLLLVRRRHELAAIVLHQQPSMAVAAPAQQTPTPVPIGASDIEPIRHTLADLRELGRSLRANFPLLTAQPWARRVSDLRQAYEQRRTTMPAVRAIEPILAYYETVADILKYKERAAREAGYTRPRPNVTLGYNSGSQVSAWLRRYPFLQASVTEPPEKTAFVGWAESNGRWSPDHAVALLVERALADGDALARRLDATGRK
jgi:hypothetical protein